MKLLFCLLLLSMNATLLAQHIDRSKYVIFPYSNSDNYISRKFTSNSVAASLTEKEISALEPILDKCLKEYNIKQEQVYNDTHQKYPEAKRQDFMIDDIKKYKIQFIAAITPKGDKIIWVNCFCSNVDYWKKQVVHDYDGGKCYFNLMIDLTKSFYYDFSVNANG